MKLVINKLYHSVYLCISAISSSRKKKWWLCWLCFLTCFHALWLQGHDCCPMLFNCDDRGLLTFVSKLDIPKQSIQRNISAMERFRNMDKRATTEDRNTTLETLHQNSITWVSWPLIGGKGTLSMLLWFPRIYHKPMRAQICHTRWV